MRSQLQRRGWHRKRIHIRKSSWLLPGEALRIAIAHAMVEPGSRGRRADAGRHHDDVGEPGIDSSIRRSLLIRCAP